MFHENVINHDCINDDPVFSCSKCPDTPELKMKCHNYLLCLIIITFQDNGIAASFMAKDPRSLAMGGTNVAVSSYGNQVLYNPALLSSANEKKAVYWGIPSFSIRVADPDNLSLAIDDFTENKYFDNFNSALSDFNQSATFAELDRSRIQVVKTGNELVDNLSSLSNKAIELQGSLAVFFADTDRGLPLAFSVNAWGSFGIVGVVIDNDLQQMRETLDAVDNLNIIGIQIPNPTTDFESNIQGRGILLQEFALSLSFSNSLSNISFSYGVTPKYVHVNTYDYHFTAVEIDFAEISLRSGLKTSQNFNMDAGLAIDFSERWRWGMAIKNLFTQKYDTILNNSIELKPTARTGFSYHFTNQVISIDYDLTQEEGLGIGGSSQYLSAGYEFQGNVTSLRFGYRHNFPDNNVNVASLGISFKVWSTRMDFSVAASENEISSAAQLIYIH